MVFQMRANASLTNRSHAHDILLVIANSCVIMHSIIRGKKLYSVLDFMET